ncbi:uncharacterized protein DUF1206 [Gelidibacter sediminis]|uniref:Uncharacterized protein DUF1206 n=1 Tax=Gelidibacter sediminis TaxID=1608710 RepID=A0A4R7Q567_9FLAO|nr:DUF1206 domain-containing protein [Gelidibacter sediminis]TDU42675.1 uncharacterized protein DUF1206 [Gelidibacter sediminis]
MDINKEQIARFGLIAMGVVYIIIGVMTGLSAFNWGGKKTGTRGAIMILANQPLGKVLLAVIALGLSSYVFWRLYQTFFDTRELGFTFNGLLKRAGYFTGGVFYGSLAFIAIKIFLGGDYETNQDVIVALLNSQYSSLISVILGLILAGKCVFEIYFILSNRFKEDVQSSKMPKESKSTLLKFGVLGHLARAVVFGIMAFLTARTGLTIRNDELSKITDAFHFLNHKFGGIVLSVVSVGLLCYGLYMFVKAKYLYINM